MKQSQGAKFRQALKDNNPLQVVGAINAYCAMLAENAGQAQSQWWPVCLSPQKQTQRGHKSQHCRSPLRVFRGGARSVGL